MLETVRKMPGKKLGYFIQNIARSLLLAALLTKCYTDSPCLVADTVPQDLFTVGSLSEQMKMSRTIFGSIRPSSSTSPLCSDGFRLPVGSNESLLGHSEELLQEVAAEDRTPEEV